MDLARRRSSLGAGTSGRASAAMMPVAARVPACRTPSCTRCLQPAAPAAAHGASAKPSRARTVLCRCAFRDADACSVGRAAGAAHQRRGAAAAHMYACMHRCMHTRARSRLHACMGLRTAMRAPLPPLAGAPSKRAAGQPHGSLIYHVGAMHALRPAM